MVNEHPDLAPGQLEDTVRRFLDLVEAVWHAYQKAGPKQVDATLFTGIDQAHVAIVDASGDTGDSIISTSQTLRDLAHRCTHRAEGLCFVTGEAGLIPRHDLMDAYENGLAILHKWLHDHVRAE